MNNEEIQTEPDDVPCCSSKSPPPPTTTPKTTKPLFKCSECDFISDKRLHLKKHTQSIHPDKLVNTNQCEYCEKHFKDLGQLNNHRNIHTGVKPFACTQCDLKFTTKSELVRHVRYKHTFERPHQCTLCEYSSVELSKLRRHMRVHTNERPYCCPYCDYASRDTFKLKRHLRIHSGEKPYKCPNCQLCFTQSNSLKLHMKHKHPLIELETINNIIEEEEEKSSSISSSSSSFVQQQEQNQTINSSEIFECNECSMKFSSQQLLNDHFIEHTGERPLVCEICKITFARVHSLRSHVLSHDLNHTQDLKQKLNAINKQTAQANLNMSIEMKSSMQNFIYKKIPKSKKIRLETFDLINNNNNNNIVEQSDKSFNSSSCFYEPDKTNQESTERNSNG